MARKANIHGGGAKTNINGPYFEQTTSLDESFASAGYKVENHKVYYNDKQIGLSVPKHSFYKNFLADNEINQQDYTSKKWLPDECFVNKKSNCVYIIEKKFQNCSGSVDEKIPNCDFKKSIYEKLCTPIEFKVQFIYLFNNWFKAPKYKDMLEYVKRVGCSYYFNEIPLVALGL